MEYGSPRKKRASNAVMRFGTLRDRDVVVTRCGRLPCSAMGVGTLLHFAGSPFFADLLAYCSSRTARRRLPRGAAAAGRRTGATHGEVLLC